MAASSPPAPRTFMFHYPLAAENMWALADRMIEIGSRAGTHRPAIAPPPRPIFGLHGRATRKKCDITARIPASCSFRRPPRRCPSCPRKSGMNTPRMPWTGHCGGRTAPRRHPCRPARAPTSGPRLRPRLRLGRSSAARRRRRRRGRLVVRKSAFSAHKARPLAAPLLKLL